MNPWNAVGSFFADLIANQKLQRWYKLGVTMFFSAIVSFLSATGTSLAVARQPWPLSIGYGMLASASALTFLWVRSPLTKDLMVAISKDTLVASEESGLVTVGGKK